MDIEYGAIVIDKNGKTIGDIDHIINDSWSGEPRKFVVRLEDDVSAAYFKPEHIAGATKTEVKLKVAFDELERT